MDHADLIAEFPQMERMRPEDRIALARDRRRLQLQRYEERERRLPPPGPSRPRLKFRPDVELLESTVRGDYNEVKRLLEEGVDPNLHNEDGLTSLHQCAIDDNDRILNLLIEHGADVNAEDTEQWTPLHAAACCGHLNVVKILIKHGANLLAVNGEGNMPYDICDDETTLDAIETVMAQRGITQQYIDEMRAAPEKIMLDDMKELKKQGLLEQRELDGSTHLHTAAAQGYYDVAAFLLKCGVSANVRDNDLWQPLHAAARFGQPDLVELICHYGGDINARTAAGDTPLDLCEDENTRAVITTMQQQEAQRRRLAFGVRDSRRQSRRRKKFESPQQPQTQQDQNPFSARGAIRRQSLRERSNMTLARIDSQKEGANLIRSWSREDVSTNDVASTPQPRDSPKKIMKTAKPKPMSPDEWLKKLEHNDAEDDEDSPRRQGSQRRRPKKGGKGGAQMEMQDLRPNGDIGGREKNTCCCVIC